ncbi:M3 family metallopeptidase [Riemerella anatipestifer]|nr:M3 family metallopeptidase [Riemerella anatipestifer]
MKNIASVLLYGSVGLSAVACTTMEKTKTSADIPVPAGNPFLEKSKLQYQAPEFDKIFKPAFDYGLKVQELEVQKISDNTEAPTFENTVLALENSGEVLKRAQSIFYNLTGSNTNDKLQALQQEYAPIFSAHSDKIYLNSKLYERIKKVYENRGGLNSESQKLVEYYKQNFDIAGAGLSDAKKEELKKINGELASLSTQFSNKLLDARKNGALIIDSVKELDGLSPDEIAAAAQAAKEAGHEGKYLLSLLNTTQQPLLQNLKNRTTREKLFKASWYRAEKGNADDTRSIIEKLARLRLKKAQVLGKKSFAEWKLQDQMAQKPEEALNLLAQLAKPAVETAKREAGEIQKIIDVQKGGFELAPWDWNFYAEQVRKAKYDLDENEIKPYFEVTTVLEKGVFYAAEKFYGITFKERKDLPVYHPDVVAYEVFDRDGKSMALYYLDFYTRNNKGGGAWMSNFVDQSKTLGQKPVIVNVFNYQKPAPGKPSLISYDDVTTMFHEFGHTLHGLFADQDYVSLSGTNVPRDFVEFPSQINEFFALEPEILKNYALHYQTKQPMPQSLIDKIKKASAFNQGYSTTELVAAATLDMAWHSVTSEEQFKPALDFEKEALNKYGLLVEQVPPRYHSPYFAHIWGGGYSAGYYAYMWSDMLNSDAWDWIKNNGGMTRANGDRFRKYILSVGNTKDLNQAYKEFTGRTPDLKPLLKDKGFIK